VDLCATHEHMIDHGSCILLFEFIPRQYQLQTRKIRTSVPSDKGSDF
jgi:hypothetical protein